MNNNVIELPLTDQQKNEAWAAYNRPKAVSTPINYWLPPDLIKKLTISYYGEPHHSSSSNELRFGSNGSKSYDLVSNKYNSFDSEEALSFERLLIENVKKNRDFQMQVMAYLQRHCPENIKGELERARFYLNKTYPKSSMPSNIKQQLEQAQATKDKPRAFDVYSSQTWENSIDYADPTSYVPNYLSNRGVLDVLINRGGSSTRFNPNTHYKDFPRGTPCLISLIQDYRDGSPIGIQRTPINQQGEKTNIRLNQGSTKDGAIFINSYDEVMSSEILGVGEGVESTLSIAKIKGFEDVPLLSLINSGNLGNFKIPPHIKKLIVAVDNDESKAGEKALAKLADHARKDLDIIALKPLQVKEDLNDIVKKFKGFEGSIEPAGNLSIERFNGLGGGNLEEPLNTEVNSNNNNNLSAQLANIKPFELPSDITKLPPRQWLYGHFLQRKAVSGIIAHGGMGKSSLALLMVIELASGKQLLHDAVYGKHKVCLINYEDDKLELQRRTIAAMATHGITQNDIEDRMLMFGNGELDLKIAYSERGKSATINTEAIEAIKDYLKAQKVSVLIIDPFVSCHGVEENDNGAIDLVVKAWGKIANDCNMAVALVHHSGKTKDDVSAANARGASSFLAALRSCIVLNHMSDKEAQEQGLDNRLSYISIEDGKANYSPRSPNKKWVELKGFELGNGDYVGVVKPYEYLTPIDTIEADELIECRRAISRNGGMRDDVRSHDWIGKHIALNLGFIQSLNENMDVKLKADMKKIISDWESKRYIRRTEGKDLKGMKRTFMIVVTPDAPPPPLPPRYL